MEESKIKVLLVDDHAMFLDGVQSILKELNIVAIAGIAKKGSDALKLIGINQPDIVITDIEMPEMTGINLTKKIKKLDKEIKVIVVSSHANSKTITDAINAGANSYIFKNTGKKELFKTIELVFKGENYFPLEVKETLSNSLFDPKKKKEEAVKLSKRETEVLTLISKEKSTQEISEALFISINTVETHRKNLMRKIGTKNMVGLVKYAIQQGIVS